MKLNAILLIEANVSTATTLGIPGSPFRTFGLQMEEGPFGEWVRRSILNF